MRTSRSQQLHGIGLVINLAEPGPGLHGGILRQFLQLLVGQTLGLLLQRQLILLGVAGIITVEGYILQLGLGHAHFQTVGDQKGIHGILHFLQQGRSFGCRFFMFVIMHLYSIDGKSRHRQQRHCHHQSKKNG